ncbi:MAG: HAMP domain-containing histidine kinase [Phycisphaerae bacterium]|nr:HAMP domain-containing histidine kinase [Phycisphaerae bacterium]
MHDGEHDPRGVALESMLRRRWFIRLRWVFLVAACAVLAIERFVFPDVRRPTQLAVLLTILGLLNLLWIAVSRAAFDSDPVAGTTAPRAGRRLELFANAQIAADLLLLTAILRYTGGVENPLAMFYLFHMAIVAMVMPHWQAILHGVWAFTLYALLVIGEWRQWLPGHYDLLPPYHVGVYARVEYVFAALAVLACGILGTLYFMLNIADRLHGQENRLERANIALRRSQEAIQDLQHRRSRFMQTAAHQLKSPLAVIQTLTNLIRSRMVPPELTNDTCDKIIRRCQEGITQVGELLTLARVQDEDPARHNECESDVREVVFEVCSRFNLIAEDKQIDLRCRMPRELGLVVRVDERDLRDAVANLVENAIKYTPSPGQVTVNVIPKLSRGRLVAVAVNVVDTGIGLDPRLLKPANGAPGSEPAFDAFRRGANVISAGISGSGLGLSIVREIVEQASGRLHVNSRPGKGSSFTVTFPVPDAAIDEFHVRDTRASIVVLDAGETNHKLTPGDSSASADS